MSNSPPTLGLLLRAPGVLNELPLAYRWEFTRRHPYYLQFWRLVHGYRSGEFTEPSHQIYGALATQILLGIGVSGDPPDPSLTIDDLGVRQLGEAWIGGAVAPATFRTMASMMIMDLPSHAQIQLAILLAESAGHKEGDVMSRFVTLNKLMNANEEGLDAAPVRPFVGINLDAPQKAITDAIATLVRRWKGEQGITESRRRPEKLSNYLRAWDLREGWTGEGYDVQRELPFVRVAAEMGSPLETAVSRYRSAFRLLSGYGYDIDIWIRLFAVLKLAERFGLRSLRRRRVLHERRSGGTLKMIPETILSSGSGMDGQSMLAGHADLGVQTATELIDLRLDVEELHNRGLSAEKIVEALEFEESEAGLSVVKYFLELMTESGSPPPSRPPARPTRSRSRQK